MNKQGNGLQALAGYALDVVRLARFDITNPHSLMKFQAIRGMQRRTQATTLVETGTFLGVTTKRCAPYFQNVYTIELDPDLARRARSWLAKCANVQLIQGDADQELRKLLVGGDIQAAVVFLDGHFSGGGTALGDQPEPAVDLLEFIAGHADRVAGVVVDDFRDFGVQNGWPKKWQLVKVAEELLAPKGFRVSVHFDMLLVERVRAS